VKIKYYIGINLATDRREVFATLRRPTWRSHGKRYNAVIGPFRNVRAALWTRDNGATRPPYRCGPDLAKTCRGRPLPASQRDSVAIIQAKARPKYARTQFERPPDAIDTVLENVGGVPRRPIDYEGKRDTLGIWAGYSEAVAAGVLKLLPPSKTRPDEIADVLGLNSAEDAWLALADAARARRGDRSSNRLADDLLERDAASAEDFGKHAFCDVLPASRRKGSAGKMPAARFPVRADELSIGDTFTIDREKFTVEHVDPDLGDVIVADGVRFGKQTLEETATLCPDAGSWKRFAPEQVETSPF